MPRPPAGRRRRAVRVSGGTMNPCVGDGADASNRVHAGSRQQPPPGKVRQRYRPTCGASSASTEAAGFVSSSMTPESGSKQSHRAPACSACFPPGRTHRTISAARSMRRCRQRSTSSTAGTAVDDRAGREHVPAPQARPRKPPGPPRLEACSNRSRIERSRRRRTMPSSSGRRSTGSLSETGPPERRHDAASSAGETRRQSLLALRIGGVGACGFSRRSPIRSAGGAHREAAMLRLTSVDLHLLAA